jgi:hypothetical protein
MATIPEWLKWKHRKRRSEPYLDPLTTAPYC